MATNQLTAAAPEIYKPEKINLGNLDNLHKIVARELAKVSRSQSFLLSELKKALAKTEAQQEEIKELKGQVLSLKSKLPLWP